jgi:hypothetical protein
MDWHKLLQLLPLVAGSVNPLAGVIGTAIQKLAEEEIAKRQAADSTLTVDEVIAQAGEKWARNKAEADALKNLGH